MDAFLNALEAVSITFSQHIVKLFHRANRSFISQPLLPAQGPWVDPGKKEDFGNLSSGGRGFQLVFEKRTQWNLIWCYHKHHFPFHPLRWSAPVCFPPRPGIKGKFRRVMWGDSFRCCHSVCKGVSEMLTVWGHRRCSPAAPKGFSRCRDRCLPKDCCALIQEHLSWKSTLQPKQLPNSSPGLELCFHRFCSGRCFPPLPCCSSPPWAGNHKIKWLQVKMNPSP